MIHNSDTSLRCCGTRVCFWQECKLERTEEEGHTASFKKAFAPYAPGAGNWPARQIVTAAGHEAAFLQLTGLGCVGADPSLIKSARVQL
jgi:hypothetical protein